MAVEAETKLYVAATTGDVTTFKDVLQQTPYLLHGASFGYSRNLLHIATMWEQAAVVKELLKINPKLAEDLDSNNLSPLHIAVAKGNLQIASMLLSVAPDMCWSRDCQDMNPIHIAAKNGHLEVLQHLLELNPFAAAERAYRGQTVLHLCVKHGQLTVLQFLVDKLGDVICAKDDDGETVLHCAVRFNQLEMVRYLIESSNINVLAQNSMGYSPLQVTTMLPSNHTASEMQRILKNKVVLLNKGFSTLVNRNRDSMMIVVALIATVAFQSIVSPPGGVWQDNSSMYAGKAVMAFTHPVIYNFFIGSNTVAFLASLIVMSMMMLMDSTLFTPVFSTTLLVGFNAALVCVGMSYGASLMMILPYSLIQMLDPVEIAFVVIATGLGIIVLLFIVRYKNLFMR